MKVCYTKLTKIYNFFERRYIMKIKNATLLLVLFSLLATSCDKNNSSSNSSSQQPNVGGFNIVTDLEEVKEIHTEQQAEYLSYPGDYLNIDVNEYPDGLQHLSDPLAVNLEWEFEVPENKELDHYSVVFGKNDDLSDGYEVTGTDAPQINIYNSYLGINYFKIVANYTDETVEESDIEHFEVNNVYPRNLKIDGMTNCRDMGGGRVLENGGKIKQGLIYRTSGTNGWGIGNAVIPDNITDGGKEELMGHLDCKTEVNVNASGNNTIGIENFQACYMDYQNGKHHLYRNVEPLKKVFHVLSDESNYPLFYHCRIGTDRTGLCAIMIGGLLGLSKNDIFQDYLFSNFGNIQEKRYIGSQAGADDISVYMSDIDKFPGEKFQNKVYNFLLSVGVPASELESVIDILTEGNQVEGNDQKQVVANANDFTASGTTKKTSADTKHPAAYYTLGASQSVTSSLNVTEAGTYKVVVYLGSTNTGSTKINAAISAKLDNTDVAIDNTLTYTTQGFGTNGGSSNRTYYSPAILAEVTLTAGNHNVVITGISGNLNIGFISIVK